MTRTNRIGQTATSIYTFRGITYVKYHNTEVISFSETEIILNSGGWYTATTKMRMNQTSNVYGLGIDVHQFREQWIVSCRFGRAPFFDGMIINRKTFEITASPNFPCRGFSPEQFKD